MEPLNVCIEKNKDRLNTFLEDLTRVENLEQHLNVPFYPGLIYSIKENHAKLHFCTQQLDKYLALERTNENIINISFNEMYFIHELLLLHKHELVSLSSLHNRSLVKLTSVLQCRDDKDPLAVILDKLGPAPEQLLKKENANIDLILSDRFREEGKDI